MKKVLLILLVFGITSVSCSTDEPSNPDPIATPDPTPDSEPDTDPVNTDQEEINTISANTILLGAVRQEGEFPSGSGSLNFEILFEPSDISPINEGVDLVLSSSEELVGAYVVLKSENGTFASDYFNYLFPEDAFQLLVDLDFNDNVVPGASFCYEVSVYDANGNVSPAQEFCANVPNWGGNDNLIGNWSLVSKESSSLEGAQTETIGEPNCFESVLFCDNGEEVPYNNCFTTNSEVLSLMSDGSYSNVSENTVSGVDFLTASETCDATLVESSETTTTTGKWVFVNGERDRFFLAEYTTTFPSLFGGEDEVLISEPGDAIVKRFFVQLQGSDLILTQEFFNVGETVPFETFELRYIKE